MTPGDTSRTTLDTQETTSAKRAEQTGDSSENSRSLVPESMRVGEHPRRQETIERR